MSHDSRISRNPRQSSISWEIQVWSWKIFEQSDCLMFQSRNVSQVTIEWCYQLFDTYDRQGNDGKEDKIQSTRIYLRYHETDIVWNLLLWRFRTLVSWQNQRNYTSWEIEFDEALQEAFYKVRTGRFFDELEVEGFLRERFNRNCKRQNSAIKNKKFIDNSCQMYQKEVFEICKQWPQFENILISLCLSVLVNQDLQRFGKKNWIIINLAREWINLYYPTAKDGKTYDFIDSYIRHKMWHPDIDATSFGFQEFLNVFDKDNITKISSRYK